MGGGQDGERLEGGCERPRFRSDRRGFTGPAPQQQADFEMQVQQDRDDHSHESGRGPGEERIVSTDRRAWLTPGKCAGWQSRESVTREERASCHGQPQPDEQERLLFGQVPVGICGKQAFCQAVGGVPHEKVGRSQIAVAKKDGREQETVAVPHVFTVHN